jgi:hypothetical protein
MEINVEWKNFKLDKSPQLRVSKLDGKTDTKL